MHFLMVEMNFLWTIQIFGPVQQIMSFSTSEEVLARANDSYYGLAAGVFSKDLDTVLHVAAALQAGTVW